jgi:hypothetical protein
LSFDRQFAILFAGSQGTICTIYFVCERPHQYLSLKEGKMNRFRHFSAILICLVALILSSTGNPVSAGEGRPGEPGLPSVPMRPGITVAGLQENPAGGFSTLEVDSSAAAETGGPDWYGYTWNDGAPFSWIDAASGGTDAGLGDEEWPNLAGPIDLPFPFRFYEDVYTKIWIAPYGYAAFSEDYQPVNQQNPFPSSSRPNRLVAPFWTVIALSNSSPDGRVYYQSGGTAPNRYFVVEWHNVAGGKSSDSSGGDEKYRFEAVFYENGDILFQYHTMKYNDWRYYASIGIEDPRGDGLGYMDWDNYFDRVPASGKAVLIDYPAPAARVNVTPNYYGDFSHPGGTNTFQIPVRNTGELGGDTFDLFLTSPWSASLYAADGSTPLTDHDGDGAVDTGVIAQGSIATIVAKVNYPIAATTGNSNTATLNVRSSLDSSKSKNVSLTNTIPASFAQVYQDSTDGAVSLFLARPGGQAVRKVSSDHLFPGDVAIVQAPNNNFLTVWDDYRNFSTATGYISVSEIYYALTNRYGDVILPAYKLTDFGNAAYYSSDQDPAVAVTRDGHFGLFWYRYFYNSANDTFNYNVYLAILNSSGQPVSGPINITNNSTWGTWDHLDSPQYWEPQIAATTDNRFLISWQSQIYDGSKYIDDIYYAIYNTSGTLIKSPAQLTNAAQSGLYYSQPGLSALADNRVIVLYTGGSLLYSILDSSGNLIKSETSVGNASYYADAVQLSGGNILVAWTYWSNQPKIQYAILSGSSFEPIHGPYLLSNPASISGDQYVSVAKDADGHGILTWAEADWDSSYNLYYALVGGDGSILTQPVIFRSSHQSMDSFIVTNYGGYGNTSYSWEPPEGADISLSAGGDFAGGQAGGSALVGIKYANHSPAAVNNVVITATLGVSLTYQGDSSGIAPVIVGNQVVWNLPGLSFLEKRQLNLYVGVPANASPGELFTVHLQALCDGKDVIPADNEDSINVMVSKQVYLPMVKR